MVVSCSSLQTQLPPQVQPWIGGALDLTKVGAYTDTRAGRAGKRKKCRMGEAGNRWQERGYCRSRCTKYSQSSKRHNLEDLRDGLVEIKTERGSMLVTIMVWAETAARGRLRKGEEGAGDETKVCNHCPRS